MSDFGRDTARSIPQTVDMSIDAGLRAFMLGVYNKMALGLLVSAGIAYAVATVPAIRDLLFVVSPTGAFRGYTMPGMILAFAPLALVLISGFAMRNPSPAGSAALYWGIVSLIGASGAVWVLRYTGGSIASIVNIFLKQPMLYWIINAAGVLIFAGLTAYDTQRLKMTYYAIGGDEAGKAVATNYGALSLYLDFINLFQFLLAFMGGRRE